MQKLWGNFRVVGSLLLVFVLGAAFVVDTLQADALTKSAATKAQARGMVDEALKASCVGMLGVQLPSNLSPAEEEARVNAFIDIYKRDGFYAATTGTLRYKKLPKAGDHDLFSLTYHPSPHDSEELTAEVKNLVKDYRAFNSGAIFHGADSYGTIIPGLYESNIQIPFEPLRKLDAHYTPDVK